MRDHKYRVWHDENRMMYYSHRPDGSDSPLWSWDVVFRKDWHDEAHTHKMEYTNLKGKGDREIYEGDICKSYDEYIHEVKFINGAFGYEIMGDFIPFAANHHFKFIDGKSDKIEIIGNRFENPELLEGLE